MTDLTRTRQCTGAGRKIWAELGASGALADVYRDGKPQNGVDPDKLRVLLGSLDARDDAGMVLSACVQLASSLPLLAEMAPESLALAATLAGDAITAWAATDVGSGSDLTALATTATVIGDRVVVSGEKRWITNATEADWLLVLARRREGSHFTNFSWVLVPADAPGVSAKPADIALFQNAGVGHIHLEEVSLPLSAVIGGAGRGLPLFARHIAVERLASGLWASAMCYRALSATKAWLSARGDIWQQHGVRERFARALVQARQLDALARMVATRIAIEHDHAAAALLKASAGIAVNQVLETCAHLYGAEGFVNDGMQRLRTEAAIFAIAGGATEVVLGGVADQADVLLRAFSPLESQEERR
ncbi:acyl-CoA dehydrogenase [Pseudomonas sp. NZIPFR-PS5]|nr:acyl-CoA dehydrogenase [Pseudomonas sp. NZIPFR-PS5]